MIFYVCLQWNIDNYNKKDFFQNIFLNRCKKKIRQFNEIENINLDRPLKYLFTRQFFN